VISAALMLRYIVGPTGQRACQQASKVGRRGPAPGRQCANALTPEAACFRLCTKDQRRPGPRVCVTR
jgi:hypothetical protein